MIDAYEIGIQLLLQEDVSAGLATITRELAEIDRAINATSAHLTTLVQEADRATKAVATAVSNGSARPLTGPPVIGDTAAAGVPQVNGSAKAEAVVQPSTERKDNPSAPVEKLSSPPAGTASSVPAQNADQGVDQPVQSSTPTAPVSEGAGRLPRSDREPKNGGEVPSAQSVNREHVAPIIRDPVETKSNQGAGGPATMAPRAEPNVGSQVAMTASIRSSRVEGDVARPRASVVYQPHSAQPADRERTFAPWAGVSSQGEGRDVMGVGERAAAPAGSARDSGGGGGSGAVMLDGRLVGQWLADHMAREASRPPSGTSFFDPRQTPAWTVSGAL